jgi:hypothetical protein
VRTSGIAAPYLFNQPRNTVMPIGTTITEYFIEEQRRIKGVYRATSPP